MTEQPDRTQPDEDPGDPLAGGDTDQDQDAEPASSPRGAAAHEEPSEEVDPDSGPASEPREG